MRTTIKQFFFLTAVLFFSACSRYKAQTSAQLVVSGLTSNLSKDLILNGISEDGEYFAIHLKGNQTPDPIEIPVGKWNFYGFYWKNQTAYCTWNSSELIGATQKIDLTFSKENCFHERFSHPAYRKNNSFTSRHPMWVLACNKYSNDNKDIVIDSAAKIDQHCIADPGYNSIKVVFPSVSLSTTISPELSYDSVVTECVDTSSEGSGEKIFVPVGANIPFHMDMMFYSDTDCEEEIGSVKLNRLLGDSNKGHYFVFDHPEQGSINLIAFMLDEFNIQEEDSERENEAVDNLQITLPNDLEVTFDLIPTFAISGLNQFDTVSLYALESDCSSGINVLAEDTTLTEDLDVTLSIPMGLGQHEIFVKSTSRNGEVSDCVSTTYTISDPDNICTNSVLDAGYETSADCGGLCANEEGSYQCNFGLSCTQNSDCGSGYCDNGTQTCSNFTLSFNGTSNYVYFSGSDAPNVTGTYTEEPNLDTDTVTDFTISMWIKSNDMTQRQLLFGQRDSSDYIWDGQFKLELNSSSALDISAWSYYGNVIEETSEKEIGYADGSLDQSKWYNFVYTVSNIDSTPTQTIYINGNNVNSKNLSPGDIVLTDQLKVYLGAEGRHVLLDCCGFNYFDGQMDDVAIWKVALDEEAVSSIYKNGNPFDLRLPSEDYLDDHINHLHAYYRFNHGEGTTVYDLSNNGFNGVINEGNNSNWTAGVNINNHLGVTPSVIGLAQGSACNANNECSTYSCHGNICQQSTFFAYCQSDSDCAEGKCDTGQNLCLGSPVGAACSQPNDCFGLSCTNGLCASSSHGDSCDIDNLGSECSGEMYCGLSLTNIVAAHNGAYIYNVYQCLKATHFSSCSSNNDCESNYCLNNVCYAKSTGGSCTGDAECFSNNCSTGWCQASEEVCSNDSDCNGKTCVQNKCYDVSAYSCWNSEHDPQEETDYNCGGSCVDISGKLQCHAGQTCSYDRDCASGKCVDSVCIDSALEVKDSYIYFDLDLAGDPVAPAGGITESNSPAIDDPDGEINWSFNIWIKTNSETFQTIVSQVEDTADNSEKAFSLKINNNDFFLKYFHDSISTIYSCDPGIDISDNKWHMVTLTKRKQTGISNKGVFNVYLDGVNCLTNHEISHNAGAISNLNKIYIGKDVASNHGQFVGLLDNLTFWNTEISSSEIEELYHGGRPTNPLINFHNYKSAYFVTNHYNMNQVTPLFPEVIHDSGPHEENGRAYYKGSNDAENKATHFDYEYLDTPGARVKTIKLKGLCQTILDDIESDLFIDSDLQSFDNLSIQNTPSHLDVTTLNNSGLELHFSDHETYSTRLILGDDFVDPSNNLHYYVYDVVNDYYDPTKTFILVDSNDTGSQSGVIPRTRCNLRDAINSWNNAGNGENYGTCNTLSNQTTRTAIIFDTTSATNTYESHQTDPDDNNNTTGDYDFICNTPNPGCEPLQILGCGGDETSDPANFTKLSVDDATRFSRIFDIRPDMILEVSNVTLDNGKALDGLGGGIKNKGTLTLTDVSLTGNIAQAPAGESFEPGVTEFYGGGGGGASGMGGAIFNDGILYIKENVYFSDNQAIGGDGGHGGEQTCGSADFCINEDEGVGGHGGTLTLNNGYFETIQVEIGNDPQGNPIFDWIDTVNSPTKVDFLINSGGHGGYAHSSQGTDGTTGYLGGGSGGPGLVDGGLLGNSLLFRAGGGGATHWSGFIGHSGGGGGGGAFGAAIFNSNGAQVHLLENDLPNFQNNTLAAGTAGNVSEVWGGGNPSMMGIGTLTNPENLFNYDGDVYLEEQVLFEFNGNDLNFNDYKCGADHPDSCQCNNGECEVPAP